MPRRPRPTYTQLAHLLFDKVEEHPIDQHVANLLPQHEHRDRIRQLHRDLIGLVEEEHPDVQRLLLEVDEVTAARAAEREEVFLDVGVELGRVAGRAEAILELAGSVSVSAAGQQLATQVQLLSTASTVDPAEATCVLVAASYGIAGLVEQAEGQDEPLDALRRLLRAMVEVWGRPGQRDDAPDDEGQL